MAKHKCVTHSAIKLNLLANDPSAWAEVRSDSYPARASPKARVGRSGQILSFFLILGKTGDKHNSISLPNYCDEPYNDLGTYLNMVLSA